MLIAIMVTVVAVVFHLLLFRKIVAQGRRSKTQRLEINHTWDGAEARPGERTTVTLSAADEDTILVNVDAPFHGDPRPTGPPGPRNELWEHEVVEVFFLGDGARYTEVELGPFGHHLVLRLHGVRNVTEGRLPLKFYAAIDGARWRGEAQLPRALLPPGSALTVNAYALHGAGTARRYLAHTPLPGPAPDFHRVDGFVVPLEV